MTLYLFQGKEESVQIYARDREHIVDLIEHYRERAIKEGNSDDPRLARWVKNFKPDDITEVDSGRINYHVGMACFNSDEDDMKKDFFSEYLRVTPDFLVAVSPEGIAYFDSQRKSLPSQKRGDLYKFQIPGGFFTSLNFIPEDVMWGIVDFKLTEHLDKGRKAAEKTKEIKRGHPNLG